METEKKKQKKTYKRMNELHEFLAIQRLSRAVLGDSHGRTRMAASVTFFKAYRFIFLSYQLVAQAVEAITHSHTHTLKKIKLKKAYEIERRRERERGSRKRKRISLGVLQNAF